MGESSGFMGDNSVKTVGDRAGWTNWKSCGVGRSPLGELPISPPWQPTRPFSVTYGMRKKKEKIAARASKRETTQLQHR